MSAIIAVLAAFSVIAPVASAEAPTADQVLAPAKAKADGSSGSPTP